LLDPAAKGFRIDRTGDESGSNGVESDDEVSTGTLSVGSLILEGCTSSEMCGRG
jgi:hypothetical protein